MFCSFSVLILNQINFAESVECFVFFHLLMMLVESILPVGCVVRDDLIYKWDIDEDDDEEEKKMMLSVTYFFYFFFDEGSLSCSSSESSSGTRTGISGREYHSFCRFSFCLSLSSSSAYLMCCNFIYFCY